MVTNDWKVDLVRYEEQGAEGRNRYVKPNAKVKSTTKSAKRCKKRPQETARRETIRNDDTQERTQ